MPESPKACDRRRLGAEFGAGVTLGIVALPLIRRFGFEQALGADRIFPDRATLASPQVPACQVPAGPAA
jgi:hypothetical protein